MLSRPFWCGVKEDLTDEELGSLMRSIFQYVFDDVDSPPKDRALRMLYHSATEFARNKKQRYEEKRERTRQARSEAGRKGAEVTNRLKKEKSANSAKVGKDGWMDGRKDGKEEGMDGNTLGIPKDNTKSNSPTMSPSVSQASADATPSKKKTHGYAKIGDYGIPGIKV